VKRLEITGTVLYSTNK